MNTRLLLHGGRLKIDDERNDAYFRELVKNLEDGDRVLFIGFARTDIDDRQQQYQKESQWLQNQSDKEIEVVNATEDLLEEQIRSAKAIQITGGESPKLIEAIKQYPDFLESLNGKVVGGSSAGACLFVSKYYYSKTDRIEEGLGVLPIKMNVHDNNPEFGDSKRAHMLLEATEDDLELILLDECEWIERTI